MQSQQTKNSNASLQPSSSKLNATPLVMHPPLRRKKNFPIDDNQALDSWFTHNQEQRIDMLKTNKNVLGLLCAGSDCLG